MRQARTEIRTMREMHGGSRVGWRRFWKLSVEFADTQRRVADAESARHNSIGLPHRANDTNSILAQ
jgi:hypothetical protein